MAKNNEFVTFGDLYAKYIKEGYEPKDAHLLAFANIATMYLTDKEEDERERERDNAEFYYDHPEGVNL